MCLLMNSLCLTYDGNVIFVQIKFLNVESFNSANMYVFFVDQIFASLAISPIFAPRQGLIPLVGISRGLHIHAFVLIFHMLNSSLKIGLCI